jgi:hypothetical protein
MTPRDSKRELLEARKELEQMYVEMDELQVRIAKHKRVVAALTELANVEDDSELPADLVKGITDACKTAVWGADRALYPSEVRDRIKALGFPEQKNLLASVHTVLKRLAEAGDVKEENGAYATMGLGDRIAFLGVRDMQNRQRGKKVSPLREGLDNLQILSDLLKKEKK